MTSLSALFSFKSLTSFPTCKIKASKSEVPAVDAVDAAAAGAAGADVADGLLSLKK